MKTPMQEHIEWLKERRKHYSSEFEMDIVAGLGYAIEHAESILPKEEALLIKTHGNKKVYNSQIDPTIVTGEEWYNKTFNTKERCI